MLSSPSNTLDVREELRRCPDCARRFSGDAAFCPFDGVLLVASQSTPVGASGGSVPWIDPLVGSTVDARYEVLALLGEGGMGRVYRVRHTSLERLFAMKVLRSELASHDDLSARFLHEARVTAAVKHPNVVEITDFGRLPDGVPYFVMELLSGQTLTQALRRRPFPIDRIVPIVRQLASALGAAHSAGVVHRDLKPDNVFLLGDPDATVAGLGPTPSQVWPLAPELRVVDFGAAKILGSDRITRAGIVFGTPHYMSPEQAGGASIDHRADVYALGIILYEMLTGRVPFESDTYMGVLSKHMFAPLKPPSEVVAQAGGLGTLEAITLKCLAKRPDERFDSMAAVLSALDLDGVEATGRAAGDGDSLGTLSWRRLPAAVWMAAGTVTLGAALAAVAIAWRAPPVGPDGSTTSAALARPAPPDLPAALAPLPLAHSALSVDLLPPLPTALSSVAVPDSSPSSAPPPRRPPSRRALPPRFGTPFDDVGDPFTRPAPPR